MIFPIVILFSLFGAFEATAPKGKRLTDEEMYHQMAAFVSAHQNMPEDKKLVENILTSAKWLELVAQYGPLPPSKKIYIPERKKPVHK